MKAWTLLFTLLASLLIPWNIVVESQNNDEPAGTLDSIGDLYTTADGIANDQIHCIAVIRNGQLWPNDQGSSINTAWVALARVNVLAQNWINGCVVEAGERLSPATQPASLGEFDNTMYESNSLQTTLPLTFTGEDEWEMQASMPTQRSVVAARASDGNIYAVGGRSGANYLDIVEAYNPATNTWTTRANMPTARGSLALAAASDGKIYAIGGYVDYSNPLNTVEAYDPTTNTWTTRASMPTARSGMGAVAASDGKIYVIGGRSSSNYLGTVEVYDPATNTWAVRASMPTPRDGLEVVEGSDGIIYAIGGRDHTAETYWATEVVEAYNPATNTWTTKTAMPTPRSGLGAAAASNGKIYACGGANTLADYPYIIHVRYSTVEEYDPVTNSWTTRAHMLVPRSGVGVVEANNGRIYAIGGSTYNTSGNVVYLDVNEAYTPLGMKSYIYLPIMMR